MVKTVTDAEWLTCSDPVPMLELLRRRDSDRKLQLFAVACCWRALHLSTDQRHRDIVEAAERFADGLLTEADCRTRIYCRLVGRFARCNQMRVGT
jgi:hypothetical protein